jgi:23S rRNA pseudouridine1911/1915/1917 synthase
MAAMPCRLRAGEGDSGRRLDVFLAERLELSRAQARRLLARGAVCVDGRRMPERAKGEPLRAGAEIEVAPFARPEERRALAQPQLPLPVLERGPGWLAVDKPPGMPVHPLEEDETGTLLNAAIARHPELHGVGEGGLRSGVVHRLDLETSGALLLATRQDAWEPLRAAFRAHRVEKVYRAIVVGCLEREGRVALGLLTARHRPARVRVVDEAELSRTRGARIGELSWRPLERYASATLVEVRPRTGFLHQIRASFAHLGFPIAGDRTYGAADDPTGAPRHMLHAGRLAWRDVAAESPDPPDFAAVCARLRAA